MSRWVQCGAAAFVIGISACGGGGGGSGNSQSGAGDADTAPVTSRLECDAISAAAAAAMPLERIALTGLTGADRTTDWVQVEVPGHARYETALYGSEDEGYELLVPLHPDAIGGGAVTLAVTDGFETCPGIAFDVLALPPASGDPVGETAAAMEQVALALANRYVVDRADLAATPLDQLPVDLVPLALAFTALDAADYATALADLSPTQLDLLQRIIARLDLPARLSASADAILALPATPPLSGAGMAMGGRPPGIERAAAGPVISVPVERIMRAAHAVRRPIARNQGGTRCVGLDAIEPNRYGIDTPDKLAQYIKAARGAGDSIGPLRQGINDLNSALAILGLVPGGGGLGFKAAGFIGGALSFTLEVLEQMRANLYPSEIDRVQFAVTEDRIPEDWIRADDGAIEWQVATLYPINRGMNLTRTIVDGSMFVFTSRANELVGQSGLLSKAAERGLGAGQFIDGGDAINRRLDELEAGDDSRIIECFNIPATEFTPVVVPDESGDQWVRGVVRDGDAIAINDRGIVPERIGASTLRVQTNTDNLPGVRAFGDRTIQVLRKAVVWLPADLFIEETGNDERVRVRFDNARHAEPADVEFQPDPALIAPTEIPVASGPDEGLYDVAFTTPTDKTLYPLEYTARSISPELPPAAPARMATLTIRTRETIRITPRNGCVDNGDELQLTAEVSSTDDNPQVEWERVAGAGPLIVGGNGLVASYNAPSTGGGQVTLRATLVQPDGFTGEPVMDEVTLSYGDCVDVAVFYEVEGEYSLPGGDANCNFVNSGGSDSFLARNDNADNDGKNLTIPLTPSQFWGPGQRFDFDESLADASVRGNGAINAANCKLGTFPAAVRNQTLVRVPNEFGGVVVYDVDLEAEATCSTFGGEIPGCSSASAFTGIWTRYVLEVDTATRYQLELDLTCQSNRVMGLPEPNVFIFVLRSDFQGNPVPINRDPEKFVPTQRTETCAPGTPASVDFTFEADDPATPGTTDTVDVFIVSAVLAAANPEADGREQGEASLFGNVRVREVPE